MGQSKTDILRDISIGIVVRDMAASHKFYTEVMDMQPVVDFPVTISESEQMGFSNGKAFHIYLYETVKLPNATHLKLVNFTPTAPVDAPIQIPDVTSERPPQTGIDGYAGVNYLSFNYPNQTELNKATDKVKSFGIPILGTISNSAFSASYLRDPNGVFIELLFVPPPPPKKD